MRRRNRVNYFDGLDDVDNNEKIDRDIESSAKRETENNRWIPFKRRRKYNPEETLETENEDDYVNTYSDDSAELLHDEDFDSYNEQLTKEEEERYQRIKDIVDKNVVQRRRFYGILISSILVVAIIFFCYQFLRAENFIIKGTDTISDEYIVGLSGVTKGQHFLTIDRQRIISNLEQNPYIKVERVYFTFPNTLRINLCERKPAGVMQMGNQYIVLDKEAFVVAVTDDIRSMNLPLIKGVGIKLADTGTEIRTNDDTYKLVVVKDVMNYLGLNEMTNIVSSVDLTDINAIVVYVSNGMKVKLGQGDRLNSKLAWANAIIKTMNEEGITSGVIDVSTEGASIYKKQEVDKEEALIEDIEAEDNT